MPRGLVNEKQTIPVVLEVGNATEQVTVEANTAQVELQSPAGAGLISGTEVREIALNNRNYLELMILMPGVVSNSPTNEIAIGYSAAPNSLITLSSDMLQRSVRRRGAAKLLFL